MKLKHFVLVAFLVAAGFTLNTWRVRRAHAAAFRSFLVTVTQSEWELGSPGPFSGTDQYAVRADGSFVHITNEPPGSSNPMRRIFDWSKGTSTLVAPQIEAVSTVKVQPNGENPKYAPAYDCPGSAAGQILGLDVTMTETKTDAPPGTLGPQPHRMDEKSWRAPALGCFALRWEQHVDKLFGSGWVNDSIVVQQVVAVYYIPVDQYFYIPPYQEMASGDLGAKLHPTMDTVKQQKFNESYYKNRP
jgi:hypothetical protein